MKNSGKLLLAMVLVLAVSGCSTKKYDNRLEKILGEKRLTVATSPDFAPNEFIDVSKSGQAQYVGSDIELAKYIADSLGVELVIKPMDFNSVLGAVTTGNVDLAISALVWKEDRAQAMEFSKGYNFSAEEDGSSCHGILVRKDQAENYTTLESFRGKTIAAQLGSLQESLANEQIPDVKLEIISSLDIGIMSLQTNKIDGMSTSCKTGELYAGSYKELAMAPARYVVLQEDETAGTRIGITKGETELVEAVNKILDEILAQGLYNTWYQEAADYAANIGA